MGHAEAMEASDNNFFDDETVTLPDPWALVTTPKAKMMLEAQLRVEVAEGHPLFGTHVTTLARCDQCDEVLFGIEGDSPRFAQVHLTWRRAPDTPPWPWTEFLSLPLFDSLADHAH